jgi:hypothetical protein
LLIWCQSQCNKTPQKKGKKTNGKMMDKQKCSSRKKGKKNDKNDGEK